VHTPRSDFLVPADQPRVWAALVAHLQSESRNFDVLALAQIPSDSSTLVELRRRAEGQGFAVGNWEPSPSPVLRLRQGWDAYLKAMSRKSRGTMGSRLRRLKRQGDVSLDEVSGGERLAQALEDGLRIEAAAWKGQAGTAIMSRPEVCRFYTRLGEVAARRNWLRLIFLTVAGRRIAFGYFLRYGPTLYLLKHGYDPAFADVSPFNLLCFLLLKESDGKGIETLDFLGDDEPWKQRWTAETRRHSWMFAFPPRLVPRLLYQLKFRVAPRLRRVRAWEAVRRPAT